MEKWDSTATPPDVIAKRIKADAAAAADKAQASRTASDEPASQPGLEHSSASSATSGSFPSLPFQMPAIHFHTGLLMNGTGGYMASPSKPAVQKPATVDVTSNFLSSVPTKSFTQIREFLAIVDGEEADGPDSPNYSQYADMLIEMGYRRIHLLYDETPKSLRADLGLPITMGDAKQLLLHVKHACQKIALGDN